MDKEIKALIDEQVTIVKELREKVEASEQGKITAAELKEAQDKIDVRLGEIDDKVKEIKATNDRIDQLETKLQQPGFMQPDPSEKSPTHKAFENWLRKGERGITQEEQLLLRPTDVKSLAIEGGTGVAYLAPGEYVNEIIKGVVEISPIRSLADVRPTSNDYVEIPKRTAEFAATWVAEEGTRSETTGLTYGMERIPNHEMYALVKVSRRALEDSAFNLEAELTAEFAEQFAKAEGTAFVTGDAVGKPEGFTVNSSVSATTVVHDASDAAVLPDGIIGLQHVIKTAYGANARFLMNRSMISLCRQAKTTTSNIYLWQPDFREGTPGTLLGVPIVEVPDMADGADAAKCMAYGDFRRGYVISDRVQIEIQRLVELYAASGQVGFLARKRVGGQVVLPEAIAIGIGQA